MHRSQRRRQRRSGEAPALAAFAFCLAHLGCEPDRGEVRDWNAADHQGAHAAASQERPPSSKKDRAEALANDVWRKNCATCHGATGRGDGPQGPMVGAKDLTRKELLSSVTDAQLEEVIRNGRNRMPAFPDLPQNVVDGLVQRIRSGTAQGPDEPED